jgi:hypothetical protein
MGKAMSGHHPDKMFAQSGKFGHETKPKTLDTAVGDRLVNDQ